MVLNANTSFLLDRLIRYIIKNPSELEHERCKRSALRTLASSQSSRINQFEITARLEGLEEKWVIYNNDALGDALHVRRAELSVTSNRWTPENLALLLQLSDRPTDHPNLADLALLKLPLAPPADIVAEDPLVDLDGIWNNVDFAADTSDDDERTESVHSGPSVLTPGSSVPGQTVEACIETLTESAPNISLREIQNAQFWNSQEDVMFGLTCVTSKEDGDRKLRSNLSELQAGREVIFALLGLPTSIFSEESEGQISVSRADFLEHASQESLNDLLQGFAAMASKLLSIRHWVEKDVSIQLEQTFQAALASRLETVDRALTAIQTKMLSDDAPAATSLMKLYDETSNISRLLVQVHDILLELDIHSDVDKPFRILECLFDMTCVKQGVGDAEAYEYMADLFFDCFRTYLKPIRLWMENGQLTGRDGIIFIERNEKKVHLNSLWKDQYHLIKDSNGGLHAPRFLHVAAKKIFNTGKSVDFSRRLGWMNHSLEQDPPEEVTMTYDSVCLPLGIDPFSPFAELFDMALNRWITRLHRASLSELRTQLEARGSLQSSLDALEYIYFANRASSSHVNNRIFEKIDRGNHQWNDGFTMTELRAAFKSIPSDRLQISPRPATQQGISVARRSMSALEDVRVSYKLPWPVANVIRTDSIEVYQRIFIFLTQLQRAKYLLQRQKLAATGHATDERPFSQFYMLRHRLLWMTNTILTYMNDMVLSVATDDMRIAMDRAEDVDSMIAIHQAYISKLEDQCLLLKEHTSIRQAITSLLDLTVLFSDVQASRDTRKLSSGSESRFAERKDNIKAAIHSKPKKATNPASDDEDSDFDSSESDSDSAFHAEPPNVGKLKQMLDTFRNLHSIVTAAVGGLSKADSAPSWEMLANNLAMGLEK